MKRFYFTITVSAIACAVTFGQTARSADDDWPMYSRDPGGSRFSPLAQVTRGNVASRPQARSVRLAPPAGRRGGPPPGGAEEAAAPPAGRGRAAAANPEARGAAAPAAPAGAAGRGAAADVFGNPPGNPEATP